MITQKLQEKRMNQSRIFTVAPHMLEAFLQEGGPYDEGPYPDSFDGYDDDYGDDAADTGVVIQHGVNRAGGYTFDVYAPERPRTHVDDNVEASVDYLDQQVIFALPKGETIVYDVRQGNKKRTHIHVTRCKKTGVVLVTILFGKHHVLRYLHEPDQVVVSKAVAESFGRQFAPEKPKKKKKKAPEVVVADSGDSDPNPSPEEKQQPAEAIADDDAGDGVNSGAEEPVLAGNGSPQ